MKICYLADASSIHTQRWVKYFAEKGHEVHLISYNPAHIENVKIYVLPKKKNRFLTFILRFFAIRKLIKNIKPDLLHAHYIGGYGWYGAITGFHPFVVSVWGSDIAVDPERSKLHKFLVKYVLRKAELVHVQDPLSKKRVKELGAKENKIKVIPWGVDITKFSPDKKSEKWRKKLQIMPGPVIIIIICDVEKRFADILANAIDTVTKSITDVNFVIVKSDKLKNKIKPNKNVQFIDWIPYPEVPFYLANSDIFIDPYYPERPDEIGHTYGMALLEAMACGVPTLVAERPTVLMLKDADTWHFGYTFKGDNIDDLIEKITKLLRDKNEQNRIIKQNRAIIEKKFSWHENMGRIEALYRISLNR